MSVSSVMRVATLVGAALMTGCGGGGGGSGSSPPPIVAGPSQPAPPTPTPTPTPSATLPPAPFKLTASRAFDTIGWTYAAGSREPIELVGQAQVEWAADLGTYRMTLPDIGAGTLAYRYPNTGNRLSFSLRSSGGADLADVTLQDGFADPPYIASGSFGWSAGTGASLLSGESIFGIATPQGSVPSSGTVTYISQGGEVLIIVNRTSGTIVSGYVRIAWSDAWGPYTPIQYPLTAITYVPGATSFSARFAIPGAPGEGVLRGRFYGPNAEEVGFAWSGFVVNPYEARWERTSGVYNGRLCPDCFPS